VHSSHAINEWIVSINGDSGQECKVLSVLRIDEEAVPSTEGTDKFTLGANFVLKSGGKSILSIKA
jgi:hypothetical protein